LIATFRQEKASTKTAARTLLHILIQPDMTDCIPPMAPATQAGQRPGAWPRNWTASWRAPLSAGYALPSHSRNAPRQKRQRRISHRCTHLTVDAPWHYAVPHGVPFGCGRGFRDAIPAASITRDTRGCQHYPAETRSHPGRRRTGRRQLWTTRRPSSGTATSSTPGTSPSAGKHSPSGHQAHNTTPRTTAVRHQTPCSGTSTRTLHSATKGILTCDNTFSWDAAPDK
jgi:hypothetical protein